MKVRNPIFNANGGINCEIEHPVYGWIPFTASPDDPEAHGREIFAALQDSAAPYVPPSPDEIKAQWRAAARMYRREFVQACLDADILTPADAVEAAKGNWPASFDPALEGLSKKEAAKAQVDWAAASVIERAHPMFARLVDADLATDEQLDALFGWNAQ